jgi:hypothetical protein
MLFVLWRKSNHKPRFSKELMLHNAEMTILNNWVTKIERFECLKRIKEISRSARNDDLKSFVWGGDMTAGH